LQIKVKPVITRGGQKTGPELGGKTQIKNLVKAPKKGSPLPNGTVQKAACRQVKAQQGFPKKKKKDTKAGRCQKGKPGGQAQRVATEGNGDATRNKQKKKKGRGKRVSRPFLGRTEKREPARVGTEENSPQGRHLLNRKGQNMPRLAHGQRKKKPITEAAKKRMGPESGKRRQVNKQPSKKGPGHVCHKTEKNQPDPKATGQAGM